LPTKFADQFDNLLYAILLLCLLLHLMIFIAI